MEFKDFYNVLNQITIKLQKEKQQFTKDLLKKSKQEIILEYVELFIYARLKIYFMFLERQARKGIYLLSIDNLKNILKLQNIMNFVKQRYFEGELFDCKLENDDMTKYFRL